MENKPLIILEPEDVDRFWYQYFNKQIALPSQPHTHMHKNTREHSHTQTHTRMATHCASYHNQIYICHSNFSLSEVSKQLQTMQGVSCDYRLLTLSATDTFKFIFHNLTAPNLELLLRCWYYNPEAVDYYKNILALFGDVLQRHSKNFGWWYLHFFVSILCRF